MTLTTALITGPHAANYRDRMSALYASGSLTADALAREFGTGGRGYGEDAVWYSPKGLRIGVGSGSDITHSWESAARELRAIIANGWEEPPVSVQGEMFGDSESS